jgi:hypothetical protein
VKARQQAGLGQQRMSRRTVCRVTPKLLGQRFDRHAAAMRAPLEQLGLAWDWVHGRRI